MNYINDTVFFYNIVLLFVVVQTKLNSGPGPNSGHGPNFDVIFFNMMFALSVLRLNN